MRCVHSTALAFRETSSPSRRTRRARNKPSSEPRSVSAPDAEVPPGVQGNSRAPGRVLGRGPRWAGGGRRVWAGRQMGCSGE